MKHETLFVDEVTKKTMEFINDEILNRVNNVLRSSNALDSIEKLAGEISGKFDTLQKAIEGLDRLPENIRSSISVLLMNELSNMEEVTVKNNNAVKDTIAKNNDAMTAQIKLLEEKINAVSTIIENQNRNSRLLEEINEKLDNLSMPFYKRIMKKFRKGKDTPSDTNKED